MSTGNRLRVAIIGSGNIGTDLLYKVRRSKHLKCTLMVGRRSDSPGLSRASKMGIQTSAEGLEGLKAHIHNIDLVFLQGWLPLLQRDGWIQPLLSFTVFSLKSYVQSWKK